MIINKITLGINDHLLEIPLTDGAEPLSKFLREQQHLTGLKIVCAEGDCGACSVLVDRQGHGRYQVLNSCILPLFTLQGSHIITIEGLSSKYPRHPMKTALLESLGSQCGFCTPGFMMTLANVYEKRLSAKDGDGKVPSEADLKICCSGHLCRCTGYQSILTGAMQALQNQQSLEPQKTMAEQFKACRALVFKEDLNHYFYKKGEQLLALPRTLKQACFWKSKYPQVKIVAGATDLGVELNKKEEFKRSWMSLKNIPQLQKIIKKANGQIVVGAQVTLARLHQALRGSHPEFSEFLQIFASPNIRNGGTLIGNIVNASPIGDTILYLIAVGATVKLASLNGFRDVPIEEFIIGYRQTVLRDDELVAAITIHPRPLNALVRLHKVSKREHMDISTLSLAAVARTENGVLADFSCVFGGLSERVRRIPLLEQKWLGKPIEEIKRQSVDLSPYFTPLSDHRGSKEYRQCVAERLLTDFFDTIEAGL